MNKIYKLNDGTMLEYHEGYLENYAADYFTLTVRDTRIKINANDAFKLLSDHLSDNYRKFQTQIDNLENQRNKLALMAKWEPVDNINAKIKDIVGDDYRTIFGKEYYSCDLKDLNYLRQANSTYRDLM